VHPFCTAPPPPPLSLCRQAFQRLLVTAAHYNSQLGLAAALKLDRHAPAQRAVQWFDAAAGAIPALASVMAWELHAGFDAAASSSAAFAVRLVVQDGSAAPYVTVPLPCARAGDSAEQLAGAGACAWEAFVELAAPAALREVGDWCAACANQETRACQLRQAQLLGYVPGGGDGSSAAAACGLAWKLAVAVVCSVVGTLALVGAGAWLRRRRGRTGAGRGKAPHAGDVGVPGTYLHQGQTPL
jgi:hypothetical protein